MFFTLIFLFNCEADYSIYMGFMNIFSKTNKGYLEPGKT